MSYLTLVGLTTAVVFARKAAWAVFVLIIVAFLLSFVALGLFLIGHALRVGYQSLLALTWPRTSGKIIHLEIERQGTDAEPEYQVKVNDVYQVDGLSYQGDRIAHVPPGMGSLESQERVKQELSAAPDVAVHYDPTQPGESCLQPGLNGGFWVILLAGVFCEALSLALSYAFFRDVLFRTCPC